MKQYKHIIWDWNGTLLDDVRLLREIVNGLLHRFGKQPITEEQHREMFGFPIIEYYKRMGFDFTEVTFERICIDFTGEYYNRVTECRLRKGAKKAMEAAGKMGITQSVLSVSQQSRLLKVVDHFRIGNYFTDIWGLGDHSGGTKTDLGKEYMEKRGLGKEEALFIGDTVHDFEVASELGLDCILVESGYQLRERLLGCVCPVIRDFEEIPGLN